MSALPTEPVSAERFFEEFVPRIVAASEAPEGVEPVDIVLGVVLLGEGGGEWRLDFRGGEVTVTAEPREDAVMTVVQPVAHWRGALWEGQGGYFGERAAEIMAAGRLAPPPGAEDEPAPALTPVTLAQLRSLDGAVRIAVSEDGKPVDGTSGWYLDLRIGDGDVGAPPDVCVSVSSSDLEAIESGELDPFPALMGGRIAVDGNMTLLLQLQAIAMQAASSAR